MTELQRDALSYAVVALLACALVTWIIPTWSPEYPGYGVPATVMPNMAAGIMLFLAILGLGRTALVAAKRKKAAAQGQEAKPLGINILYLVAIFAPCFLLMKGMSLFGFVPAGIVFMGYVQIFLGQRKPLPLLLVSVLPVLALHAVMRYGLGVPMP